MKSQTTGNLILYIVKLCLSVLLILYFLIPNITFFEPTEKVEASAALIGVCSEDEAENKMNITDLAKEMIQSGKGLKETLKVFKDVPTDLSLAPMWCYGTGIILYLVFAMACLDVFGSVLGIFLTVAANNADSKEKKSIFSSQKSNVATPIFFYLVLILVQLCVLQPINKHMSGYGFNRCLMLVNTLHPVLVICGVLLIFFVAKKIVAKNFYLDE